ncbi:serine hydrolase [Streptomyces sp. NPDC021225]|uniref:serine hydrolase n=1 Tax=Streptomyces sp. NPDC021225 TaxID=3365121 RepID=UPI00379F1BBF
MESGTPGGIGKGGAHRGTHRPATRRPALYATAAALALLIGAVAVGAQVRAHDRPRSAAARSSAAASPSATASGGQATGGSGMERVGREKSGATASATPSATALTTALTDALDAVADGTDARFSAAVLDTGSAASAVYGGDAYDTASIVKVDILAALLLRAQDAGRQLTAQERSYAGVMIQQSDNDAATALWQEIGGATGLDAANKRLGLTETHGGQAGRWGLTRTTAADQLRLLREIFATGDAGLGHKAALSERSRDYIQQLMGQIAADQAWGVSAAADDTTGTRLKNGWLPRSATGLWDVNSIGRVTAGGRTYLVAVLSDGHQDMDTGVTVVETAARAAVHAAATA